MEPIPIIDLLIDILKTPIILMLLYLIGKTFYFFPYIHNNGYAQKFLFLTTGLIISIFIYSIVLTSGKTINSIGLILIIIYLIWKRRPYFSFNISKIYLKEIKFILLLSAFAFIVMLIQFYRTDFFNEEKIRLGWIDYKFYSDIAYYLTKGFPESTTNWTSYFNSTLIETSNKPNPYHYFELWMHSLVLLLSKSKGVIAFMFFTIPLICTLVFASFLGLITVFNKKRLPFILTFFFAFTGTFFVTALPFKTGGLYDNPFFYPRVLMFYISIISFIILLKNGYKEAAILIFVLLPIYNILYAPTVLTSVFLLSLLYYFQDKDLSSFKFGATLSIISVVLIILFYMFLFKTKASSYLVSESIQFATVNTFIYSFFRLYIFRLWFFALPLTIFIIANYIAIKPMGNFVSIIHNKKIFTIASLFFVAIFFLSIITHLERGTIGSIVLNPLFSTLSIIAIIKCYENINQLKYALTGVLLIVQFSYSLIYSISLLPSNITYSGEYYSRDFIIKSRGIILQIDNKIGGQIQNTQLHKENVFFNSPHMPRHASFFDCTRNGFVQTSLSTPKDLDSVRYKEIHGYIANAPFYKFTQSLKQNGLFTSLEEAQIEFIKKHKIEYLIIEPGADITKSLGQIIQKRIIDNESGHTFALINKHFIEK